VLKGSTGYQQAIHWTNDYFSKQSYKGTFTKRCCIF